MGSGRDYQEDLKPSETRRNTFNEDYLSLENTFTLRFFAAMAIVVAHISYYFGYSPSNIATIGVGIFFFTSGYGLTYSYSRNPESIRCFNRHRWIKLLMPLWIITVITAPVYLSLCGIQLNSAFDVFRYFFTGNHNGFVLQLITFYAMFYVCFRFLEKKNATICVWLLSLGLWFLYWWTGCSETWYNSTLIFAFGVTWCMIREHISSLSENQPLLWMLTVSVFIYICFRFTQSPSYGYNLNFMIMSALALILVTDMRQARCNIIPLTLMSAIASWILFSEITSETFIGLGTDVVRDIFIIAVLSDLLIGRNGHVASSIRNIGKLSYEIYLLHWPVAFVLEHFIADPLICIFGTIILTIIISWPMNKINVFIVSKCESAINRFCEKHLDANHTA